MSGKGKAKGAAKAENAPVAAPDTQPAPNVPQPENSAAGSEGEAGKATAKEGAAGKAGPAPEAAGNGTAANSKADKPPERTTKPELTKEAKEAIQAIDFRVKELRAIDRKEGAINRKLINVPGVKEVLQERGWFIGESGDPLNYHVKFAK